MKKRTTSPHSIAELVEKHEKAKRDLSDTLSETGQFEARQILKEMRELERDQGEEKE